MLDGYCMESSFLFILWQIVLVQNVHKLWQMPQTILAFKNGGAVLSAEMREMLLPLPPWPVAKVGTALRFWNSPEYKRRELVFTQRREKQLG